MAVAVAIEFQHLIGMQGFPDLGLVLVYSLNHGELIHNVVNMHQCFRGCLEKIEKSSVKPA